LTYDWEGPHPYLPQRQRTEGKQIQAKTSKALARLTPNPPPTSSSCRNTTSGGWKSRTPPED
jgi:hypothetical protein